MRLHLASGQSRRRAWPTAGRLATDLERQPARWQQRAILRDRVQVRRGSDRVPRFRTGVALRSGLL